MKSRATGKVMEGTQSFPMGGVNSSWWSMKPSPPVTTLTSYQQQQHQSSYNLLLHPSNNNNFLSYIPPTSGIVSPYSPQPTSSSNSSPWHDHDNLQQRHHDHQQQLSSETWSQLFLGGLNQDEEEKQSLTQQLQTVASKLKMQNWEEKQVMLQQTQQHHLHDVNYESNNHMMDIKLEHHWIRNGCYNMFGPGNEEFLAAKASGAWSSIVMPNSSPPKSRVTSFGYNKNRMLDFSSSNKLGDGIVQNHLAPEHPSESNSSATGGASKKARVQPSPPQSNTFRVTKEKLGDRITALHQLVSPFGKTDTASVLLKTMGYIRFLQSQIEALSLPYLGSGDGSESTREQQHQQQPHMHAEATEKDLKKDLKSRGLCLVPISCTLQVGSDNESDYWAPPAEFGGVFH